MGVDILHRTQVTMSKIRRSFVRHAGVVGFVFLIQFFILLPIVCHTLPFSAYFGITSGTTDFQQRAKMLNDERVKHANIYFKNKNGNESLRYYHSIGSATDMYLAVAIVTVRRSGVKKGNESLGYVLQTSAGIDSFARSSNFINRTFVFLCNVDSKPDMHEEAHFLEMYLPFIERYGSSSFKVKDMQLPHGNLTYNQRHHKNTHEKETFDYSYCLKVAESFHPEFILMVEDDAVPHADLSSVLKHSLDYHLVDKAKSTRVKKKFCYLKLYYPEKWQGFAFELPRALELVSFGCVGGGISVLCRFLLWNTNRRRQPLFQYFLLGMILFMLTTKLVGRQNVLELRRLSKYLYQFRLAPGCCTPATLYPSAVVEPLTTYLTTLPSPRNTDLAIYDFVRQTNIPAYQLEPNLFHHIGMHSSLGSGDKDAEHFVSTFKFI
ncbi:post-GPI attachment to proteins factor 4-like [Haliotis rufescens]|uniref:post-GPI attachment to proteins factor 4-like n=1 Tax=Haliotis rufescens TaxID=6454 RepID=UPI00201EB953|nr:post-GPI attachment to proteins factor 4-like [Haliotis rufescens]